MSENNNEQKFIYGVLDTFELKDTSDIAVIGRVKGTIKRGDTILIRNYGDDDDEIVTSSVVALETKNENGDRANAEEATDCLVSIRIRYGMKENIKPGSVIFTDGTSEEDIRNEYVNAIANSYVGRRDLEIYETELSKMSITDCSESWRFFTRVHEKDGASLTEEQIKDFRRKIGILANSMVKKILAADEIYYVKSKVTNEPFMFSRTISQNGDFLFSPPEIQIFSKPYKKMAENHFPTDKFEIAKIENNEEGTAIKTFIAEALYLNGAMGVRVNYEIVSIGAITFFKDPYDKNIKGNEKVVSNPELVRWMLLRAQIGTPSTDSEKINANLYYRFFAIEMLKAKFLVPAQPNPDAEGDSEETTENGEKLTKLKFPILVGRKGTRNLVFLYTDLKRMRMNYDEEWDGFIQTIDKFIPNFDVSIDNAKDFHAGCFVTKDIYEGIQKMLAEEEERKKKLNDKK